jgi:hypothetical protein
MTEAKQDEWVQCPPGELCRLGTRLRMRRRVRALMKAAVAVVVAAGVGGGIWLLAALASPSPRQKQGPCHPETTPCSSPAETPPPCSPP